MADDYTPTRLHVRHALVQMEPTNGPAFDRFIESFRLEAVADWRGQSVIDLGPEIRSVHGDTNGTCPGCKSPAPCPTVAALERAEREFAQLREGGV